jgi:hypothetical protein
MPGSTPRPPPACSRRTARWSSMSPIPTRRDGGHCRPRCRDRRAAGRRRPGGSGGRARRPVPPPLNELHIEAGPRLNGSLIAADLVDECLVYLAPLPGPGPGMAALPTLDALDGAWRYAFHDQARVGDDLRLLLRRGQPRRPDSPPTIWGCPSPLFPSWWPNWPPVAW